MSWLKHILNLFTKDLTHNQHPTASTGISVSLPELLAIRAQAAGLKLKARRTVSSEQTGTYQSRIRGRGMDFAEVRNYQPGDDIRHIEWRVTARTNRPHTKVFQEERERPVYLVVDYNPSMFFGTRVAFKSVIAAQTAAMLAWAAAMQGDRVGGIIFSATEHHEFPPRSGQHGVLPLLKNLADLSTPPPHKLASNPSSLTNTLVRLRHVARPGSLIIILSDFYYLTPEAIQHLSQLSLHNQIIAGFIYDQLEQQAPPPNYYAVSNGEITTTMDTTNPSFCSAYHKAFAQREQHLKMLCTRYRITQFNLATHQAVFDVLKQHLGK